MKVKVRRRKIREGDEGARGRDVGIGWEGKEGGEGGRQHHALPPSSALTHMGDLGLKPSLWRR